jgi:hypothetical protein
VGDLFADMRGAAGGMGGDTDEAADFGFDDHKRVQVGRVKKAVQNVLGGERRLVVGCGGASLRGGEDAFGLELLAEETIFLLQKLNFGTQQIEGTGLPAGGERLRDTESAECERKQRG